MLTAWQCLTRSPVCLAEAQRGLAADDGRRFVHQRVVFEGRDHEQGEVDAAGAVAHEQRVADVTAPHREPLAFTFLEIAPADDRPPRGAREDASAGFDLVVDVGEPKQPRDGPEDRERGLDVPRVDVFAVAGDVPAAGKDEASARRREVEHRLRRARRVLLHAPGHEHHQHPIAPGDGARDQLAVVRRPRHQRDAAFELVEFADAAFPAHAHHLVPAGECVSRHVQPQLPRDADDADLHGEFPPKPNRGDGPAVSVRSAHCASAERTSRSRKTAVGRKSNSLFQATSAAHSAGSGRSHPSPSSRWATTGSSSGEPRWAEERSVPARRPISPACARSRQVATPSPPATGRFAAMRAAVGRRSSATTPGFGSTTSAAPAKKTSGRWETRV